MVGSVDPYLRVHLNLFDARPVRLGIDEAGRGPVLGPMVYACFYCPAEGELLLKDLKVDDSKKLTEQDREQMFTSILNHSDEFGWRIHGLLPQDLSMKMLRQHKYNLNEISHDTAISLIRETLQMGVNVTEVFIDTVGKADIYQRKLQALFPSIKVTVAEKADATYPVVSAASICAKVSRDHMLRNWIFDERGKEFSRDFGSGYPGDPRTISFLEKSFDPVFGFASVVRFSWGTAKNILLDRGVSDEWYDDDEGTLEGQSRLSSFFLAKPPNNGVAISRGSFFKKNKMEAITSFI